MYKPLIKYYVSSPSGDIPVDKSTWDLPLDADPDKTPYHVYFQSVENFIIPGTIRQVLRVIAEKTGKDVRLKDIGEILIRAEKHGALYHPASIEFIAGDDAVKFCLNVAVSAKGRESLRNEYEIIKGLLKQFSFSYLPKVYFFGEMNSITFLLEEWFEGYHEFHLALTDDGSQQIKLWEYGTGERLLSQKQSLEIYRQAAQILTLYYNLRDFRLICPWHHAAGDFIASVPEDDHIAVRLTTVRGYEPFLPSDVNEMINPVLALFYFLLHLSLQMRLDRCDGVGDVMWADDYCVDATVAGFLQGIEQKSDFPDSCGSPRSFVKLLKSFTQENLRQTVLPIAEQFRETKDYRVIQGHLKGHIEKLYVTLQNCP